MGQMKQKKKVVEFVVCGRFDRCDDGALEPRPHTYELIDTLKDAIRRRELNAHAKVSFCNCGQAEKSGPSIAILPERVRYFDVDPSEIPRMLKRHVEVDLARSES